MVRKTLRRLTRTGWLVRLTAGRYGIVPLSSGDETTPQVNCYVVARELLGETSYYIYHLQPKQEFLYLFDYGDAWRFRVRVYAINPDAPEGKYPRIAESVGEAPEQYPDWG